MEKNMKNLVFDIGANRGNMTEFFLRNSNRVVCFEPNPSLIEHLRNRFSYISKERIIFDDRGISDKEGKKIFNISNADTISTFSEEWINKSRFTGKYNWGASIEVETTTIDSIIEQYGIPDFVKIDVEGHELEVIKGFTKTLSETIFSFEWAEEQYHNMIQISEIVKKLGYLKFAFTYSDECTFGENLTWTNWDQLSFHERIDINRKELWGMIYFKI
jgi:FkbM family methyltransferase